jgi:predicted membrane-bound dolichyl-phosphate-mannose-protein mannosyltransferase
MGGAHGYNTKYRDLGCPAVLTGLLWYLFGWHWIYILTFGLSFASLTTYWDWLFKKDNFYMHGFAIGVAVLPLMVTIPLWIILVRCLVTTVGMGLWSKWIGNDVVEEVGRGVLFIL